MLSATPLELLGAAAALCCAVAVGTVCHELSHAIALRAAGVPCEIEFLPDRGDAPLRAGLPGAGATVTPTHLPDDVSPDHLRIAALTPLFLAAPFALVLAGAAPDPFAVGSLPLEAAAVGWLACALPSPQDFSLVWYPEAAIAEYVGA